MTILHSALLENPNICYEISNKRLSKRKLEMLQEQTANMFSSTFNEMLANMLEINPHKRISFDELQKYLSSFFSEQSMMLRSSINEGKS
jgi:hypothetical protein